MNRLEYEIRACLHFVSILKTRGEISQTERFCKMILSKAERSDDEGPLTGLVLLDLHDLYEQQGRHDEAAPVWARARKILIGSFHQLND